MTQALQGKFNNKGKVHMQALNEMQELFLPNTVEASRVKVKSTVQNLRVKPFMMPQPVHAPQPRVAPQSPPTFLEYLPRASLQLKLKALQTKLKHN